MLAFAAVAQCAPGILAALYWGGASRAGVFWGMLAGFIAWIYLLFLPSLAAGGLSTAQALAPHDVLTWLWPRAIPDYLTLSVFGPGAVACIALNVLILVIVSMRRGVTLQERLAARAFRAPKRPASGPARHHCQGRRPGDGRRAFRRRRRGARRRCRTMRRKIRRTPVKADGRRGSRHAAALRARCSPVRSALPRPGWY